jgi:uncharacterized protein YyaL (SSP411 family)
MAESDPALSTQDAQTANVRVGSVENRLSASDRLSSVEGHLARHDATFEERDKAVARAEAERVLAAQAVKDALDQAKETSSKALEALALSQAAALISALENANKLEEERVGRVSDEIEGVKDASKQKAELQRRAQDKFEAMVANEFSKMNEFRDALEDLGKGMATRRELEVAIQAVESTAEEQSKQIGELRTAVAVGPSGLPELKAKSDQSVGEQRMFLNEKREVIAAQNRQIALVGVIATILTVVVYVIIAAHP